MATNLKLNGDFTDTVSISGNLEIDGTLNAGDNTVSASSVGSHVVGESNTINGNYNFVSGKSNIVNKNGCTVSGSENIVGLRCYAISSLTKDDTTHEMTFSLELSEGESIDPAIGECVGGDISTADWSKAAVNFAKIKSVDLQNNHIVVHDFASLAVYWDSMVVGTKLYFSDSLGNIKNVGNKISDGVYSTVCGYKNISNGDFSHTEGRLNKSLGAHAHTEGKLNISDWGCHSEGCNNRALANASHSENRCTKVNSGASYSHTEGIGTVVDKNMKGCHAAGYLARAKDYGAYVWNGADIYGWRENISRVIDREPNIQGGWALSGTTLTGDDAAAQEFIDSEFALGRMYPSHGKGTFNINPQGGAEGFYIGEKKFPDAVTDSISGIISQINDISWKVDALWENYISTYDGNVFLMSSGEWKFEPSSEIAQDSAFSYRSDVSTRDYGLVRIASLSNKYTSIAPSGLCNCVSLKKVNLPYSIKTLGNFALQWDNNLSDVNLEHVTYCGVASLRGCKKVSDVSMDSVTAIASNGMQQMYALSSLYCPELTKISSDMLGACNSITDLTIPSVTSIEHHALREVKNLTSIDMSDASSVVSISVTGVFDNVTNKVTCYIPQGSLATWSADPNWATYLTADKIQFVEK